MVRSIYRRRRWLTVGLGTAGAAAVLATLMTGQPPVALAAGFAALGWGLAYVGWRQPLAEARWIPLSTMRGGEDLVGLRVINIGLLPMTISSVGFASDRTVASVWWPRWHRLLSELPGRPLHHGDSATYLVAAATAAAELRDLYWMRVERVTGEVDWVPIPAAIRESLADTRERSRRFARYRAQVATMVGEAEAGRGHARPEAESEVEPAAEPQPSLAGT